MFVALTFDDGYRDQLSIARYLAKRGVKATFFVITGLREFMGRRLLRPSEIKEIASMGHEIGSHTVTHIDMVRAPEDVMRRELVESKKYLSELLNNEVTSFAYPYGPHSETAARLARQVYRVIRTTYIGSAKNYNLLDEHGCIAAFNLRLSNIYELIRLRKLNILVLYAHLPSRAKLDIMLAALKVLKARFVTISEAF
ncbi:MAG: polysaccharide deacetylase family protein [Thermofilum sp.]|nr:polysaccharide deacetylase family protein [Thermofilum sp.]